MKKTQTNVRLILTIMKYSAFQIILAFFLSGIVIASPEKSLGQSVLDEVISLSVENRTVKNVLTEIERTVKIKFTYNPQAIPVKEKISITLSEIKLSDVLDRSHLPACR